MFTNGPVNTAIVQSYSTGVTLRQLFYRLVSALLLPNTQSAYKRLSSVTAEARRRGEFPELVGSDTGSINGVPPRFEDCRQTRSFASRTSSSAVLMTRTR